MPIEFPGTTKPVTKDEYHGLDYRVMGQVFRIQNDLGRLFSERIYQREIAVRCREVGLEVDAEVPVHLSFGAFKKTCFIDLLVEQAVVYELKAVEALHEKHRCQALNYLFLTGLGFGKLVNMASASVQHEFVTTSLTPNDRFDFAVQDDEWKDLDGDGSWLRESFQRLVEDWGLFLDVNLYREALCCLRGGEEKCVAPVAVCAGGRMLGWEPMDVLNPVTAFRVTALRDGAGAYEPHLKKLLGNTALDAIQWINLSGHEVTFKTLLKA